eukprot:SM000006S19399  [mRNA]  locus=s6:572382:574000:+ [translate_table: standard]
MKRPKKVRGGGAGGSGGEGLDVLYYNQLLDILRHQQEAGIAYYGDMVYQYKPVPPEAYPASWKGHATAAAAAAQASGRQALPNAGAAERFTGETPSTPQTAPGLAPGFNYRLGSMSAPPLRGSTFAGGSGLQTTLEKPMKNRHRLLLPPAGTGIPPSPEEDTGSFPAATKAAKMIFEAREKYKGTPEEDRWKAKLADELEAKSKAMEGEEMRGPFSEEEDTLLLVARYIYGNRWFHVEKCIPRRVAGQSNKHWHGILKGRYKKEPWCERVLAPPPELVTAGRYSMTEKPF